MTPPNAQAAATRPGPIDCETAVRRLWDFLDGRLSAVARDEVEAHLAACALCPPHFAFARAIRASLAVSALPGDDADEAQLRQRIRGALRRQAAVDDLPAARGDAHGPGS
ncbi:MAG TPA: zf-HC2 domain-containing protein [Gemmatirosa sp.]